MSRVHICFQTQNIADFALKIVKSENIKYYLTDVEIRLCLTQNTSLDGNSRMQSK